MRSPYKLCLLLLLAACGAKKNSSEVAAEEVKTLPVLAGSPAPRDSSEGMATRVQIACEAGSAGLLLPNSKRSPGDRVRDQIKATPSQELAAPTQLALVDGILRLLYRDGDSVNITDYSFVDRIESGAKFTIPVPDSQDSVLYRELGIARPRVAASAPDRQSFALLTKGGIDLRSTSEPEKVIGQLKLQGSFANPRWEPSIGGSSEIFLDRVGGKSMRQQWLILENGEASARSIPKPVNGHQIGLRRFNPTSLIWLEWDKNKSVVRIWNTETNKISSLSVPSLGAAYGPGFALYQAQGQEKVVVLQSSKGIHFFSIERSTLKLAFDAAYSELVTDTIRRGFFDWSPGAIYSAANDTQLFVVLPTTWGKLLFSLEEGALFRQLGHDSCLNPDFYPEK